MRRHPPARGHLQPHLRHRPRQGQEWRLVRPRGQPAHPVWRIVSADRALAVPPVLPADVPRARHPRQPRLRAGAQGRHESCELRRHQCHPDAGPLQLRLLRALVSRGTVRSRARREHGPLRGEQLRLLPQQPRPDEGRRHLPAPQRRLPRSALFPPRLSDWRAEPHGRLPCGQRRHPQHAGQRRRR